MDYTQLLWQLDRVYFESIDFQATDREVVAYHLATWLFDASDETKARKRMKRIMPAEIYLLALEKFIDEDHDT